LLHTVELCALLETLDLPNHVMPMIGDAKERIFDTILELGALDPLAKLAPAQANLLELLQLNLFDDLSVILFVLASGLRVARLSP